MSSFPFSPFEGSCSIIAAVMVDERPWPKQSAEGRVFGNHCGPNVFGTCYPVGGVAVTGIRLRRLWHFPQKSRALPDSGGGVWASGLLGSSQQHVLCNEQRSICQPPSEAQ